MKSFKTILSLNLIILITFSCGETTQMAEGKLDKLRSKALSLDSLINSETQKLQTLDSMINTELKKTNKLDSIINLEAKRIDSLVKKAYRGI